MEKKFERTSNDILSKAFSEKYQNKVGWFKNSKNSDLLHNNSKELLDVLNENKIINNNKNYKVLEIGAAGCRNLK